MKTIFINSTIHYDIARFKSSRETLGSFLEGFLSWADDNEIWFDEGDNYQVAIDYFNNKVELLPEPTRYSFKDAMTYLLAGRIMATYDSEKHEITAEYKYYKSGDFGKNVNGFWAVIRPNDFFNLNKEQFILIPKGAKNNE